MIFINGIDLMNMHTQHYTGEVSECASVFLQGMGFVSADLGVVSESSRISSLPFTFFALGPVFPLRCL